MNRLNKTARILTFPGAYIRTFWERIFATLLGIPVTDTNFLRSDGNAGRITIGKASAGQLFLYTLLTGIVCAIPGVPTFIFGFGLIVPFGVLPRDGGAPLFFVGLAALYLGLSLVSNLFPSRKDAKALAEAVAAKKSAAVNLFGGLYAAVVRLGAFLEHIGLAAFALLGGLLIYFAVYFFGKA
jgi:hypothetical protein